MGFFDSIIEEDKKSTQTVPQKQVTTKNDDEELLIIDNSEDIISEGETISGMLFPNSDKQEEKTDIQDESDSIISFDESPKEEIVFQEEIKTEEKQDDGFSFGFSPEVVQEEIKEEVVQKETNMVSDFGFGDNIHSQSTSFSNPDEILKDAIGRLNDSYKFYEQKREVKMSEIEEMNKQIAELKNKSRDLLNETKEIGKEEEKIKKLIDLMKAQSETA